MNEQREQDKACSMGVADSRGKTNLCCCYVVDEQDGREEPSVETENDCCCCM